MPVKAKFNLDDLFGKIYRLYEEEMKPAVIEAVRQACLETVANAKSLDTYKDRTGNLRSSIGFAIYDGGEKVNGYFQAEPVPEGAVREVYSYKTKEGMKTGSREVKTGGDGEEGVKSGQELADGIAGGFPDGIVAVIVAGMDYALWVESNGLDVITGSCLGLKSLLEENLRNIGEAYKNG
ncbi:MAG: hypothetical protein LBP50_09555 [Tannerella sp.]|jgi:hypothetical protein|nr:hypothetical protein [Tannerella sp.]